MGEYSDVLVFTACQPNFSGSFFASFCDQSTAVGEDKAQPA